MYQRWSGGYIQHATADEPWREPRRPAAGYGVRWVWYGTLFRMVMKNLPKSLDTPLFYNNRPGAHGQCTRVTPKPNDAGFPALCAAAGGPTSSDKASGMSTANGIDYKVHLDGYDVLPASSVT